MLDHKKDRPVIIPRFCLMILFKFCEQRVMANTHRMRQACINENVGQIKVLQERMMMLNIKYSK